jgi:hypothetical protein
MRWWSYTPHAGSAASGADSASPPRSGVMCTPWGIGRRFRPALGRLRCTWRARTGTKRQSSSCWPMAHGQILRASTSITVTRWLAVSLMYLMHSTGMTPLMSACHHGHVRAVSTLLATVSDGISRQDNMVHTLISFLSTHLHVGRVPTQL